MHRFSAIFVPHCFVMIKASKDQIKQRELTGLKKSVRNMVSMSLAAALLAGCSTSTSEESLLESDGTVEASETAQAKETRKALSKIFFMVVNFARN